LSSTQTDYKEIVREHENYIELKYLHYISNLVWLLKDSTVQILPV